LDRRIVQSIVSQAAIRDRSRSVVILPHRIQMTIDHSEATSRVEVCFGTSISVALCRSTLEFLGGTKAIPTLHDHLSEKQ
jgi:hypothetical protein